MNNEKLVDAWFFLMNNNKNGYNKGISKLEANIPAWTFTMWKEDNPDETVRHEMPICEGRILTTLMTIFGIISKFYEDNPDHQDDMSFGDLWMEILMRYFDIDDDISRRIDEELFASLGYKRSCHK